MGVRNSVSPPKSGYNKGTIRSDIRYLVVSRDVRAVTAEVASSSLVVPAIHSKRVARISFKPSTARKGRIPRPFYALFSSGYEAVASCPAMRDPSPALEEKTSDTTAA